MGFACPGLTHCISCGQTLDMSENILCKSCEKAKEQRQLISYGEWLRKPENLAPSCNHHRLEPIKLIIASKPEPCKYCELKKKINFNAPIYLLQNTEIVIEDNLLKIIEKNLGHNLWKNGEREIVKIEINYCPICGRKLV